LALGRISVRPFFLYVVSGFSLSTLSGSKQLTRQNRPPNMRLHQAAATRGLGASKRQSVAAAGEPRSLIWLLLGSEFRAALSVFVKRGCTIGT